MKMIKKIFLAVGMIAATSMSLQAQDMDNQDPNYDEFGSWDTNRDDRIDENEFNTVMDDNDYYNRWDADRDNRISETEWNTGIGENYPDYDENTDGLFDDWDTDRDGYLNNDEYYGGTFNAWDDDRSGYLDTNEYGLWYNDGIFE
jgi:Ca2+-binding EF-hand superfamily protein